MPQNGTPLRSEGWTRVTIIISHKHQRTRFYPNGKLDVEYSLGWYYPHDRIAFGNP